MVSSLDMDDNRITGLSLHPVTGDEAIRDGPLERLWGGKGIFEPQEFFFVIKFLV